MLVYWRPETPGDPMTELTLYLDQDLEEQSKSAAEAAGKPLQGWVTDLIRERLAGDRPARLARLAGAWADAPTAEEIGAGRGQDVPREPF